MPQKLPSIFKCNFLKKFKIGAPLTTRHWWFITIIVEEGESITTFTKAKRTTIQT